MLVNLEAGFRKADINIIPTISNEMIFEFIANVAKNKPEANNRLPPETDLIVDYVQVRKSGEICETHGLIFSSSAIAAGDFESHIAVGVKVDTKNNVLIESICEICNPDESCNHILAFIFWLYRKSTDNDTPAFQNFWGQETEHLIEESQMEPVRIRDMFAMDELRREGDIQCNAVTEQEGANFVEAILNQMDNLGLTKTAFYGHFRSVSDDFEPLFIHHMFLNSASNGVRDVKSFVSYMEEQNRNGLLTRLAKITKSCYRSPLWLEIQYLRLRCSFIHRIISRKTPADDDKLVEDLFGKHREYNIEEKQETKIHKRFILKQTEKLKHKIYEECGLLLNDSYPFLCAAPDGITDDHIVEIKAPKTEEEFEQYLEGRETIAPKYMAQIQIQMYMASVPKALYCVLSPAFNMCGALHYVWVQADMEFVASLLGAAEDFWRDVVLPRISKIYFDN